LSGAVHGAAAGERANGGAYAACGSGSLVGFSGRKLAAQDGAACAANGHACADAVPKERQPDLGAPCTCGWSELLPCHAWLVEGVCARTVSTCTPRDLVMHPETAHTLNHQGSTTSPVAQDFGRSRH